MEREEVREGERKIEKGREGESERERERGVRERERETCRGNKWIRRKVGQRMVCRTGSTMVDGQCVANDPD